MIVIAARAPALIDVDKDVVNCGVLVEAYYAEVITHHCRIRSTCLNRFS